MTKIFILLVIITSAGLFYFFYNKSQNLPATKLEDKKIVDEKIVIYTKSYCPFCKHAKNLLHDHALDYKEIDITSDSKLHKALKTRTNGHSTVPYIFIKEQFIGGFQELLKLSQSQDLNKLVE